MDVGTPGPPIRLLLVEEQPLFLAGLSVMVAADAGLEVVAATGCPLAAMAAVDRLDVDVVVVDPRLTSGDGLAVISRLAGGPGAAPRVLALTNVEQPDCVVDCLRAGASGFILKRSPAEALLTAIHAVHAGQMPIDPALTARLIAPLLTPASVETPAPVPVRSIPGPTLSARETEIVAALMQGLGTSEIARELCVQVSTVKTHVSHILAKWGVRDRVQLVHRAHALGFATGHGEPSDVGPSRGLVGLRD